jgi:hypothetical protein
MALDQLKPEIWIPKLEQARMAKAVAAPFCNQSYTGSVKAAGDSVRISELARPTVTTTTDGQPITISSHEALQSAALTMQILQQSYFDQLLNDSDKVQGIDGVVESIATGGAEQIADAQDVHILTVAAAGIKDAASAYKIEATTVLGYIDAAAAILYGNKVPANEELELIVTPRFYTLFKQAYQTLDTNNSEILKNGIVGRYGGITVRMSNNVVTANSGAEDLCILRTNKAIAFVNQWTKFETLRSENAFGDVLRGHALYQAKLVRPKELIVMNVKYA